MKNTEDLANVLIHRARIDTIARELEGESKAKQEEAWLERFPASGAKVGGKNGGGNGGGGNGNLP